MRQLGSQGRLIVVFTVLSTLMVTSFCASHWLTQQRLASKYQNKDELRLRKVNDLSRVLENLLEKEIEILSLQALQPSLNQIPSTSHILHWVEFDVKDGAITKVNRVLKNSSVNFLPDFEEGYLISSSQSLDPKKISQNGIGILRLQKNPLEIRNQREFLSFAFPVGSLHTSLVLVLVDPVEIFPSIQKWSSHGSEGQSRSYIIGSDGRVLTHSQKSQIGNDFSSLTFFKQQLEPVFQMSATSGSGDFITADQASMGAAYLKIGSLPLVLVVEEPNPKVDTSSLNLMFLNKVFLVFLFLSGIMLGFSWILQKFLVKVVTLTVVSETRNDNLSKDVFAEGDFLPLGTHQNEK